MLPEDVPASRFNGDPLLQVFVLCMQKKGKRKSRECHNHKPQPFPDTKRKRKPTNPNEHKSNNRTKSTKISSLFPKRGNQNAKTTEKTQEQNKTRLRHKTNRLVE